MSSAVGAAVAEAGSRRFALPRVPGQQARQAWVITAALGCLYLLIAPSSPDLAAADYRSALFRSTGFSLWDNSWYGGHHLPAYSLLAPALGALIGTRLLAALSMTLATALFARLIEARFSARASRLASVWFALGASVGLLSSRVPFDLGLAVGLGALLAARRDQRAGAIALAVLCALASPIAGAFLALASLAWLLAGGPRRDAGALLAATLVPIGLLAFVFPEGGSQPFVASAFYPALGGVLVLAAVVPREQRELRIGTLLYALALVGSYVLSTAVGGNVDRLGSLVAGPLAALALAGGVVASRRRRLVLLALAPVLFYWQANAPVTDFIAATSDRAVRASYYSPLLDELNVLGVGTTGRPARIEAVATVSHWEARFLAPHVMLARGWERQLDRLRNAVFYESRPLTPARYEAWLAREAVSFVALGDGPLDYSARVEARLLRGGRVAALREIWRSPHWRLYAVSSPRPLADPPATLARVGPDSFTLLAPRAGSYTVRLRFTPYWGLELGAGCVSSGPEGWTQVRVARAGAIGVGISFSLARIFSRGPRCA